MSRRKRETPEQAAERVLRTTRVLSDHEARIAFHTKLAHNYRLIEDAWSVIRAGLEVPGVGRGDKWSATYHLRRAHEEVEVNEAIVAALRGDLEPLQTCSGLPPATSRELG